MGLAFFALTCSGAPWTLAAPIPNGLLEFKAVMDTGAELDGPNSNYNPRHFAGVNFVTQINNTRGVVWYPAGFDVPAGSLSLAAGTEARMWSPFGGNLNTEWALLAGGVDEDQFSRLELDALDLGDRVFAGPDGREPNSFDWVDGDTIV